MQQDISIKVHPSELKHFFRHVCIVGKRHGEKDKAREELNNQVKKIKKISLSGNAKQGSIEKEVEQLNSKIDAVLQKESRLLSHTGVDENIVRHLKGKIKALEEDLSIAKSERDKATTSNKGDIKAITDAIIQMKSKMHQMLNKKMYREERIKELEEKIGKSKVRHPSP